tara:strand:- start:231 stop:344 length:114 start_codon:yes stop_codon:yes gene_type:complete
MNKDFFIYADYGYYFKLFATFGITLANAFVKPLKLLL